MITISMHWKINFEPRLPRGLITPENEKKHNHKNEFGQNVLIHCTWLGHDMIIQNARCFSKGYTFWLKRLLAKWSSGSYRYIALYTTNYISDTLLNDYTDSKLYESIRTLAAMLNCEGSRKGISDPNGKLVMLHLMKSIWWASRNDCNYLILKIQKKSLPSSREIWVTDMIPGVQITIEWKFPLLSFHSYMSDPHTANKRSQGTGD